MTTTREPRPRDPYDDDANETATAFAARVLARTGIKLASIPVAAEWPGGHIFCARRGVYVLGVGYPSVGPDGAETYTEFRRWGAR